MSMIDFHAHYIPEHWPVDAFFWPRVSREGDQYFYAVPGRTGHKVPKELFSFTERIKKMDCDGVEKQVISAPPFTYTYDLDEEASVAICSYINDATAKATISNDRLWGLGTLPLQNISASIEELKRIQRLGLKGITMGTSVRGKNLDDPSFYPLWEALVCRNMPALVNSYGNIGAERLMKYNFGNLLGNGFEIAVAGASLIFGGVLEQFSGIKFCFTLGGGSLPFQMGRLLAGVRTGMTSGAMHENDPLELFRRLYFDTLTHSVMALEYLISMVNIDQVVMGSDYPFEMGDRNLAFRKEILLGKTERNKMEMANVLKLLGC
jgi:aminocarboxymuconate-semialdehyde decarboxylase